MTAAGRGALTVMLAITAVVAQADPPMRQLSERDIRRQIVGRVVTDGAHWADEYLPDGQARGHSLGNRYAGTWKIENDELCITRKGKAPTTECFEVWAAGTRIEYRRGGVALASGVLRRPD